MRNHLWRQATASAGLPYLDWYMGYGVDLVHLYEVRHVDPGDKTSQSHPRAVSHTLQQNSVEVVFVVAMVIPAGDMQAQTVLPP